MKSAALLAAVMTALSGTITCAASLKDPAVRAAGVCLPASGKLATSGNCPANNLQPDGMLLPGKMTVKTSLQVPISKRKPNKAFPASDWAVITPGDFCTVFNLVLKAEDTVGKICNLVFDLPATGLGPAPYVSYFQGSGKFTFTGYDLDVGAVAGQTTFNKQPRAGPDPPNPPSVLAPGNSYIINSAACPSIPQIFGPDKKDITVSGSLCSNDSTLVFKKGKGQCPQGFYVFLTDDPTASQAS